MRFNSFGKRGEIGIWKAIMIMIIILIVAVLFFIILKDRIGGLLHL